MKNLIFSFEEARMGAADVPNMDAYTNILRDAVSADTYDSGESSLRLPSDTMVRDAKKLAEENGSDDLRYVIVVGIGGSNLGTEAVYKALYGALDFLRDRTPKLIFLDTVSPTLAADVLTLLDTVKSKEELLINIISKSGGTTETVAHFELLHKELSKRFGDASDRFILTTDEGSKLWILGAERGMVTLPIPLAVGGRFSVFTHVGLFPLALAGVDVDALLAGAAAMRDRCLSEENIALRSAEALFAHERAGVRVHNSFFFNPELECVGKWYRQLMGESIGKQFDASGAEVRVGITPIVSVGSTDLHSMVQLYLGGPKDKFTQFVYAPRPRSNVRVPDDGFGLIKSIQGTPYTDIMNAILEGTKAAYRDHDLPYAEIDMGEISEHTLGQYLQYKMLEIMYLAKLFNVNAFDQPNVEDYKVVTKKLLEG